MNNHVEDLLYRRQFLFSPKKKDNFPYPNWTEISVGNSHWIYAHPDLPITQAANNDTKLTLIGFMVDANKVFDSDKLILEWIFDNVNSKNNIFHSTESIGGRWILIVEKPDELFLFHDPCGLRQVLYYKDGEKNIWCCSQPTLLAKFTNLVEDEKVSDLRETSRHSTWLPGDLSEYLNLKRLLPNHFLNLIDGKALRFWPNKPIGSIDLEQGANEVSLLLKNLIENANIRFDLSLPLTAGRDSRTLLSACKNIIDDVYVYTMLEPTLQLRSLDIEHPRRLMKMIGRKHNLIYGNKKTVRWFENVYMENVINTHSSYWMPITFGFLQEHPQHRITLNGNSSEIARCYYYKNGYFEPDKVTANYLAGRVWTESSLVIHVLDEWLKDAKTIEARFNVNVLDLFYWEHRMGGLYAKHQSVCDIGLETFTPFNNRSILQKMLAVDTRFRLHSDSILYKEIINILWPELLSLPFNRSKENMIIRQGKNLLKKLGVFEICKSIYYKWTKKPIG